MSIDDMDTESITSPARRGRRFEELAEAECLHLLAGAVIGRIVFSAYGTASIRPVNFVVDEHAVVFRTASGAKFSPALRRATVSFEADRFDPVRGTGWSVIVAGATGLVHDPERTGRIGRALDTWMPGELGHLMYVDIEHVTGRRIVLADAD
ncbi:MAG TPA: pyridoxamine 5'-phosphate oxidase family protein [Actinocrinis sp.]|nr:pyridoxamine 5'-phosphate oxidase family protein [Actinocrinis sp.]